MTYEITLETPRDVYTFTVNCLGIKPRGTRPAPPVEDNSIIEDLTVKPTALPNNTE